MSAQLAVISETSHQQCRECKAFKTTDQFELRVGEQVWFGPEFAQYVCFDCRRRVALYMQADRQSTAAEEKRTALVKQIVQKMRGDGLVNAPHITELSHEVFGAIGGVKRFAGDLKRLYEDTMRGIPLKPKMDMARMLVKLSEASTEHRPSAPDMKELSDEELAAVVKEELAAVLNETLGMLSHTNELPDEPVPAS